MTAILMGSISTLADTSELQRAAFDDAFAQHGLDRSWDQDDHAAVLATKSRLFRDSLFDVRIDPAGTPWFLEAGLCCSFAQKSVVPMMAAAGTDLPTLLADAITGALAR